MTSPETHIKQQFTGMLLSWFSTNSRNFPWRHESDPYKVLVAEKLLQQTTYGHVLKVYELFINKYPNLGALSAANEDEIKKIIKRIGFHNQRSKQFKDIANTLISEYGGKVPNNRDELLKLNGVGDYIANAVLCFAFNVDIPIVDMNVRRVVGRFFGWHGLKDKELLLLLADVIPQGKGKQFNWGIIDFSSLVCSRKPKCSMCILSGNCLHFS